MFYPSPGDIVVRTFCSRESKLPKEFDGDTFKITAAFYKAHDFEEKIRKWCFDQTQQFIHIRKQIKTEYPDIGFLMIIPVGASGDENQTLLKDIGYIGRKKMLVLAQEYFDSCSDEVKEKLRFSRGFYKSNNLKDKVSDPWDLENNPEEEFWKDPEGFDMRNIEFK